MTESTEYVQLLQNYYGDFFEPLNWETANKKCRNFFAKITKGKKTIFNRKFINSSSLDDRVVFNQKHFPAGEIIEQKSTFIKGTKQETTFHGFFIVHLKENGIYGEKISQKDALEFFDLKQKLPELQSNEKNNLRVKLGTVIRKLTSKYGEAMISEVLTDILEEYFPNV
ncbi:hypothetical protein [Candidatus Lokiarchaeum ossiferum]|uniref:hypothetical protein n=1 Tax=Candidatus Lokiarchaeum ossiferum TaxID=2951803 RepID=UPI00352CA2F6